MTRRTGYTSRGAVTTLTLGDPQLGTKAWSTEYDIEYTELQAQEVKQAHAAARQSVRASLRTPRSLKKGYVHGEDYEQLDEQYGQAVSAYRDLQLQVGALEQRLDSMRGSEQMFLSAVEEQHDLIDTLRQQVAGLTDSLGRLMGGVERNRSLMAVMNTVQGSPPAQVAIGHTQVMQEPELTRRLASLEAKMGEMAEAITTLSRSQTALASQSAAAAFRQRGGEDEVVEMPAGKSRGASRGGPGRSSEVFERLPRPVQRRSTNKHTRWMP